MVDQPNAVNHGGTPIHALVDRSRTFLATVMDLASLQGELAAEDASAAQRYFKQAMLLGGIGLLSGLAAVPLAAAAAVDALVKLADWPLWASCLAVAAAFALIGFLLAFGAWKKTSQAVGAFGTSRREAKQNLAWLRRAVSAN